MCLLHMTKLQMLQITKKGVVGKWWWLVGLAALPRSDVQE